VSLVIREEHEKRRNCQQTQKGFASVTFSWSAPLYDFRFGVGEIGGR
jgi:hypothetical protein